MVQIINKISDRVNSVYIYTACLFLFVVIVSTFIQVTTRYVFNVSQAWTEELARYAFVWLNMLGASVAVKSGTHAAVTFLEKKLPPKARSVQQILVLALMLTASMIMVMQGIKMFGVAANKPSPAMGIPMEYVYLAVPVGGFAIAVHTVNNFVNLLFKRKEEAGA